ncbi:MAG: hypothetical protein UT90_C0016G0042 [Parcubacteria group bacterium GW2011_GWA1_40_21]|nr:MAG: hypothetical protein UT80_C0050G0005 [Parcubacteria group bacterium GW2011_GWC1_40_13]KKR53020.1 MAG: hypothetical protein UT90_C0016G0042 [Parcubacteria group bacterium GW2011_GWA1_40_21]
MGKGNKPRFTRVRKDAKIKARSQKVILLTTLRVNADSKLTKPTKTHKKVTNLSNFFYLFRHFSSKQTKLKSLLSSDKRLFSMPVLFFAKSLLEYLNNKDNNNYSFRFCKILFVRF